MFIDSRTRRPVYSPSDLVTFLASPFAAWMNRLHIERPGTLQPDEAEATLSLAAKKGDAHEATHLAALEREHGAGVHRIDNRSLEDTRAAIRAGHRVIYQAALAHGDFVGHADFLVRRADSKTIGYDILDTKLARSVKPYFLLQLAAYARMLEQVQGHLPHEVGIVLGTGTKVVYPTLAVLDAHARVESQFLALMHAFDANVEPPFPDARADHGRWSSHAAAKLEAVDHLSRVARITSKQIQRLEAGGVKTLTALATSTDTLQVPELDERILARLRQQARLQKAKRPGSPPPFEVLPQERGSGRGLEALPPKSRGDVFFDMEGYPFEEGGLEYLFGAVVEERERFVDFWALDKSQEQAAFEGFVDYVEKRRVKYPDLHVYHYAPYEPSALKRLAGHYGTREDVIDRWLRGGVCVDLLQIVRDSLRIGEPSYSLKNVERLYRPAREGVTNAGESIVEFARFHEQPDATCWQESAILRPIREYNEDDCVSTRDLRNWLALRQEEAHIRWRRPFAVSDAEKAPAREEDELVSGLLEAWPATDETTDATIGRTLAYALGYHAREDKPQWWALFDWRTREPADLCDEKDVLAGLVLQRELKAREGLRVARYSVPPQECRHEAGAELAWWNDFDAMVRVLELDYPKGTALLQFLDPELAELPQELALTPGKPFDTRGLRAAIRRVATRYLADESMRPALATFLRREPPSLPRAVPLQRRGETASDALVRIAPHLKDTCLVVQGPPGAGKTTTAARAIAELIARGLKVGVTSNAHKPVDKLLTDVRKLVRRATIFKVGGGEPCDAAETITDVRHAVLVKPEGKRKLVPREGGVLVGGALRAFAAPGADSKLDVLFVDEASQVALANLIAISDAASGLVLLGDPRQLPQPCQGTHPAGLEQSALELFLGEERTLSRGRGLFLEHTHRLHPALCRTISDTFYEGRLQRAEGDIVTYRGTVAGRGGAEGVCFVPVEHAGNAQESREEVAAIVRLVEELCRGHLESRTGKPPRRVRPDDILVIAPYNLQVNALARALPGLRVGTVDRFQGQEAPLVIFSTTTSSAAEAPRGLDFLFDARRLNVALSRAKALAILVGSPALSMAPLHTVAQYLSVSMFCRLSGGAAL